MQQARPSSVRTLVDSLERRVGPTLDRVTRHDAFGHVVTIAVRTSYRVRTRAEHASRRVLHSFNIPAASDMNRVLNEISRVERQLQRLSAASTAPAVTAPRGPRSASVTSSKG